MSGSSQVGSGILSDSDLNVAKKRRRHNGPTVDITVAPCAGDLLEHAPGRESASDLSKKTVSSGTSIVGQVSLIIPHSHSLLGLFSSAFYLISFLNDCCHVHYIG